MLLLLSANKAALGNTSFLPAMFHKKRAPEAFTLNSGFDKTARVDTLSAHADTASGRVVLFPGHRLNGGGILQYGQSKYKAVAQPSYQGRELVSGESPRSS